MAEKADVKFNLEDDGGETDGASKSSVSNSIPIPPRVEQGINPRAVASPPDRQGALQSGTANPGELAMSPRTMLR